MSDPVIEASEALDSGWKRVREVVKGMFKGDSMPFFVICLAGLMGGALSESAFNLAGARVLTGSDLPTRMALGMVAAGVGTLILANSDRRDRLRLFFFAMLCGLCYPNVIGQAMSDVERRAKEG